MNSVQTIDSFVIHLCSVPTTDVSKWCWVTVYCASMFKTPRSARVHGERRYPTIPPLLPSTVSGEGKEMVRVTCLLASSVCIAANLVSVITRIRQGVYFRRVFFELPGSSHFSDFYWLHALIWIEFLRMPFTDRLLIRNSKVIRTLCLRKMGADKRVNENWRVWRKLTRAGES